MRLTYDCVGHASHTSEAEANQEHLTSSATMEVSLSRELFAVTLTCRQQTVTPAYLRTAKQAGKKTPS